MSNTTRSWLNLPLLGLCLALALTFGLTDRANAQVLYGSITGQVLDSTGGAIPGAEVTIVNVATNYTQSTVTNDVGAFTLPNVPGGTYTLTVALTGFKEFVNPSVGVTPGVIARVNATLQVGEITESITVSGAATLLKTDATDVSAQLESKEVTDLPLGAYRNFQSLLNLVPGATPGQFQNAITDTPGRALTTNINGTNRNSNNTRIDGASSVNIWLPHHAAYVPPSETIEVVNISTNNFDAEQGFAGGASVTVVTKSGTNDVHGTAFWYHENSALNARYFFNYLDKDGDGKADQPAGRRHIWGGTIGGPAIKDKLFYFAGFEATQQARSTTATSTLPTAAMRNGDFSAFSELIYDPFTGNPDGTGRTPFDGNIIPSDRLSAAALKAQDLLPLPNLGERITDNHEIGGQEVMNRYNYDFKGDWYRSDMHRIWGKFSWMDAEVKNNARFGVGGGGAIGSNGDGVGNTDVKVYGVGHNWTFSPTFLADGNFGFTDMDQEVLGADFGLGNYGTDVLGIPGVNAEAGQEQACIVDGVNRCGGVPSFWVDGYTGFGQVDGWTPIFRNENSLTFTHNFSWSKGDHEIRFGYDLVKHMLDHWQPEIGAGPRGSFAFDRNTTSLLGGAAGTDRNAWASYLLGLPRWRGKSLQWELMSANEWQHAFYIRDRWQVTPKLTFTLGLRYEYFPLVTRDNRDLEYLALYDTLPCEPQPGETATDCFKMVLGNNINVSKSLFAPRIGFAYRLTDDDVFRAGYGITNSPIPFARPLRGFYPLTVAADFNNQDTFIPEGTLDDGIPVFIGPETTPGAEIALPSFVQQRTMPANKITRGYIQSWNVVYERKLPAEFVTSIGYVGTRTVHQLADHDLNWSLPGGGTSGRQLYPTNKTFIGFWDGWLSSNYHSLQIAVNRRFVNGLFVKGAYTWSKAMNMSDDEGWAGVTWNDDALLSRNRARAGYDRPHILQLAAIYELPWGKNQDTAAAKIYGGWQLNGIYSITHGSPFTVTSGGSLNAPGNTQTADQVKSEVDKLGGIRDTPYYDTSAFAQVTRVPGTDCTLYDCYGDVGRNTLYGPDWYNFDLSVFRNFALTEDLGLEFRTEFINFTNTPKFNNPSGSSSSSSFFLVTSSGGAQNISAPDRFIRFALKLKW